MEQAARLARFGDRIVSAIAAALILLMLLYGGYSLWDTAMVFNGAFVSNDLLQFKPVSTDPDSNPTLAELQQINPDCIAWLTVDDTHIDYPVVQGEDNMEYINTQVYMGSKDADEASIDITSTERVRQTIKACLE